MHISGKILLGFALIGCVAALYLSAKELDIRNQWMAKVQKLEADYAANEEKIAKKIKDLHEARTELARVMLDWERYWGEVPALKLDGNTHQFNLGQTRGLADKQVVFAFAPNGDGTFTYVGDFRATTVQEGKSQLEPNWRARPGEINAKAGNWRIRSSIPAHYQSRFQDLEVQFVVLDELRAANTAELARATELIKVAEEHLALRMGEINGVPELEGKILPPEAIKGLLTVMVDEEEARNAVLAESDRLRRQLKVTTERFDTIRAANQQLVRSLPQPAPKKSPLDVSGR